MDVVPQDLPKLRLMSWNIQCLGGRFGQPERRKQEVIDAIVKTITFCNPHIVAVMEVLGHKGLQEIKRIYEGLLKEDNKWVWFTHPDRLMTGSETYVFFYRGPDIQHIDICPSRPHRSGDYAELDSRGNRIYFPLRRYRHPMQAIFKMKGELGSRKRRAAQGEDVWFLPGVVFHAPSPSHGEDTAKGVYALGKVPALSLYADGFVAADLNYPLDEDEVPEKADVRDRYYEGLEKLGYFRWSACQNDQESTIRRAPIIQIPVYGGDYDWELGIEPDEQWTVEYWGKLREQWAAVLPVESFDALFPKSQYTVTHEEYLRNLKQYWQKEGTLGLLVSRSYDQILIKYTKEAVLQNPSIEVFQMLRAVSPESMNTNSKDYPYLYPIVRELYPASELVTEANILRVAGMISDHKPLVMTATIT